jgi:hypothetical protein
MTRGSNGSAPASARTAGRPVTTADLPIRVPLIHGETTASFLARTAAANGIGHRVLLEALHRGRLSLPGADVRPQAAELFLTAAAAGRLAALVERPVDQLHRALPNLRTGRLLDGRAAALRVVPWPEELGARPLKACPLCLEDGAWLVAAGQRWRPCGCGRRWMAGDGGGYLIDTGPVPDLSRALMRHRAFGHRLGPAGDALVADAHQVTLWWWVSKQVARELWRTREDALPVGPRLRRRQAAPAVVYPEAVALAEAMNEWEERRVRAGASPQDWLADVATRFNTPGIAGPRGESEPLRYWLELHQPLTDLRVKGRAKAQRRWEALPALHHRPEGSGLFRVNSCLRWVYGKPLSSISEICPYCNGRAPTCRWLPFPDCPERARQLAGA